ncbi:hypothetical protein QE152_g21754 [Popillia japonica]|uniref:Uncharacterized protein n=1 Tax=Popillia japonica TaxID=7064 RepID=A0AAW1KKV7_POPJA
MKQELPRIQKPKNECVNKYNVRELQNNDVEEIFEEELIKRLQGEVTPTDIERGMEYYRRSITRYRATADQAWNIIEKALQDIGQQLLSKRKEGKKTDWYNTECKKVCEERNKARLKMLKDCSERNISHFKEMRNIAKRTCRNCKRQYLDNKLRSVETHYQAKNIRNFYQEAKKNTQGKMRSLKYCRNELGELVGNIEEKTEVWARYFDKLLSGDTREEEGPVVNLQDNVRAQLWN